MTGPLLVLWRLIRGPLQWRVLWLLNSKFILNASGVILDDRGRVLLLRHRFWPAGSWGIPGGYVHRGEVLEDALAREVREETGLTIEVDRLLRVNSGYQLRLEAVFIARMVGGTLRVDEREVLEAGFFSADGLPAGLVPAHREAIQQALFSGIR